MFQQLHLQDKIYIDLGVMDIEDVVNETGCLRPCQYTEYSLPIGAEETPLYNESHLFLMLARKTATKRTEVLLYPGTSFVSELGGALGLFVGFSFWMIWDLAELTIKFFIKYSNKKNANKFDLNRKEEDRP